MTSHDIEDRISAALHARTDQVTERDLRPPELPAGESRTRRTHAVLDWPWATPLLAAAAVAALAIGTTAVVHILRADKGTPASPVTTARPTAGPTPTRHPTAAPTASQSQSPVSTTKANPSVSQSATNPGSGQTAGYSFGYQPLWPFAALDQAAAWESVSRTNGSQPWHADAAETALLFTRNYLGFTELDRVTSTNYDGSGAHVGVGYLDPNGRSHTSAVLHLVRFGPTGQSPWEVVGSDDTTLSLEHPAYGATVASPVVVGGHVTGVDESIRVSARSLTNGSSWSGVLATIPAGGTESPWTTQAIDLHLHGVLTIIASTGGHLQQVERFAIQGITAT